MSDMRDYEAAHERAIDANPDPEIEAMRDLVAVLTPFDSKTQRRMIEWLVAYMAELPVAVVPSFSRDLREGDSE
jgi:hypothetical protein